MKKIKTNTPFIKNGVYINIDYRGYSHIILDGNISDIKLYNCKFDYDTVILHWNFNFFTANAGDELYSKLYKIHDRIKVSDLIDRNVDFVLLESNMFLNLFKNLLYCNTKEHINILKTLGGYFNNHHNYFNQLYFRDTTELELLEITEIETIHEKGCETCDYGSSYGKKYKLLLSEFNFRNEDKLEFLLDTSDQYHPALSEAEVFGIVGLLTGRDVKNLIVFLYLYYFHDITYMHENNNTYNNLKKYLIPDLQHEIRREYKLKNYSNDLLFDEWLEISVVPNHEFYID